MFDDHNTDFDLMMKSVLESGQEEVPAHIWDGVSSSLDKMARRKKVLVIFRRCAIGCAAAASLALGLFFGHRHGSSDILNPMPDGSGMIAVIPADDTSDNEQNIKLIAAAENGPAVKTNNVITTASELIKTVDTTPNQLETAQNDENITATKDNCQHSEYTKSEQTEETAPKTNNDTKKESYSEFESFLEDWEQDEIPKNRLRTSIELSGLAATNNSQNKKGNHIMKRPTLPNGQETTGITDNSTKSTFGIPLSFGAAIKIDFTPRWALSVGARYTLLTRKFYGTYTKVDEVGTVELTESSNIRNSQHYVGIPVNAYFNIVNRDYLKFYIYAGGAAEKCVRDQYQILSSRRTHVENIKGLQWSVNAGLGVEFSAGKHLGIYIDPSLRYYIPNELQPKSLRSVKPLMLGFEAGLRIRL